MKALVVGGSSGIGAACVRALYEADPDRHFIATAQRRDPWRELGPTVYHYEPLDLRWEYGRIVAAVKRAADRLGGLDALVVSGGVGAMLNARFRSSEEPAVVEELERTNDLGARACFRGAVDWKRTHDREGTLRAVYIGSSSVRNRATEIEDYAASKAAAAKWWLEYGRRFAKRGVRASVVEAGWTEGPMIDGIKEEVWAKILRQIPLGRPADPEEIAECVRWLVLDAPDYVAANVLQVSGGV